MHRNDSKNEMQKVHCCKGQATMIAEVPFSQIGTNKTHASFSVIIQCCTWIFSNTSREECCIWMGLKSVRVLYSELKKTSVARGPQCSRCQRGCRQTVVHLPHKEKILLRCSGSITDVPAGFTGGGGGKGL